MPPRISDGRRAQIVAAIRAANGSRSTRSIGNEFGISASTVTKIAKNAGIQNAFDRTEVEKALTARAVDHKARRAVIADWLLDDIDRFRARAWSPYTQVISGPQGAEFVTTKLPSLGDQRNAYVTIAMNLDKHVMLARFDYAGGDGPIKGLLGTLLDGIRQDYGVDPEQAGA